jgi:hypothetical protein
VLELLRFVAAARILIDLCRREQIQLVAAARLGGLSQPSGELSDVRAWVTLETGPSRLKSDRPRNKRSGALAPDLLLLLCLMAREDLNPDLRVMNTFSACSGVRPCRQSSLISACDLRVLGRDDSHLQRHRIESKTVSGVFRDEVDLRVFAGTNYFAGFEGLETPGRQLGRDKHRRHRGRPPLIRAVRVRTVQVSAAWQCLSVDRPPVSTRSRRASRR